MTILSYGLIGPALVGFASAVYLYFKQKQSPILQFITWSLLVSTLFVLVLKNILFESYIIRSGFAHILPYAWSLDDWMMKSLNLVNTIMNGSLIFIILGIVLPIVFSKLTTFSQTTKIIFILSCLLEGYLGLMGNSLSIQHIMINFLAGVIGYMIFVCLIQLVSLKRSLVEMIQDAQM